MQLVTWNTQWCCGLDGRVDVARIVHHALSLGDVDVLCLQEIADGFEGLAGQPGCQPTQIEEMLPAGWQIFYGAAVDEWTTAGRQRFGNLIATRLPVRQLRHHPLPYPHDGGVRSMPRMATELTVQDPRLGPVRVMTTHLEFFSPRQRMAQAQALRALLLQASAQAACPPPVCADGSPFQSRTHTPHAVLCGDFNLQVHAPEYAALSAPLTESEAAGWARAGDVPLHDAWQVLHPGQTQPATFCVYDRRYEPEPVTCDFVWVSDSLRQHVRALSVDGRTQASDHQPMWLSLD